MKVDISQIGPFLLAAALVLLIYRRFRRNFGQQPLRPKRMIARIVMLVIAGVLLSPIGMHSATFLGALLGGLGGGIALGLWGATRTRFLWIDAKLYYVPHTGTGVAVSLLFVGRLIYRLIQVYAGFHPVHTGNVAIAGQTLGPASMVQSPLTLGLFFVLVGYYVFYYSAVIWKSRREALPEAANLQIN